MDIRTDRFYFFSGETDSPGLPTEAMFVRSLRVTGGDLSREVALVKLKATSVSYPSRFLALVPRNQSKIFVDLPNDEPTHVNVIVASDSETWTSIDLADPKLPFNDIGGICASKRVASKWQIVDPPARA